MTSFPSRNRSQAQRYNGTIAGQPDTTMITSRGCNRKCSFCGKAVMDQGIFLRSAGNVLGECARYGDWGLVP